MPSIEITLLLVFLTAVIIIGKLKYKNSYLKYTPFYQKNEKNS